MTYDIYADVSAVTTELADTIKSTPSNLEYWPYADMLVRWSETTNSGTTNETAAVKDMLRKLEIVSRTTARPAHPVMQSVADRIDYARTREGVEPLGLDTAAEPRTYARRDQ